MTLDPNFPDRDKYFPNNKDGDGVYWIRTYRVYTGDSGTFGSQCSILNDRTGEREERIDEDQLAFANNHDEAKMDKLRELTDDIFADWQSIIQDVKFIRAPDDEPAHINIIRRKRNYVGTIGFNPCFLWFIREQDGFDSVYDPVKEDGIPRACWNSKTNTEEKPCRYAYIQNVNVGSSVGGYFGPSTMGIFSHEVGHIMKLGHVGDVMYYDNTRGNTILTGQYSIRSIINGTDHGGAFKGNETLDEYKERRLAVRVKHYDDEKIAKQEEKDIFDFRDWPTEEVSTRKKWTWQLNDWDEKTIGKHSLARKLGKLAGKPQKIKNLNIKRIQ